MSVDKIYRLSLYDALYNLHIFSAKIDVVIESYGTVLELQMTQS